MVFDKRNKKKIIIPHVKSIEPAKSKVILPKIMIPLHMVQSKSTKLGLTSDVGAEAQRMSGS